MATRQRHFQGGLIAGLLLIGLGILFLVSQFVRIDVWGYFWPFILICIGLLFFAGMVGYGKGTGGLAIPGSMFVMTGLVGLLQTIWDLAASSAYLWTLIAPTSVGIGLIIFGWWSEKPRLRRAGLIVTGVGLLLFLTLGALFELLFGLDGQPTPARFVLPVVIIGLGLLLLFGQKLIGGVVSTVMGSPSVATDQPEANQMVRLPDAGSAMVGRDAPEPGPNVEPKSATELPLER